LPIYLKNNQSEEEVPPLKNEHYRKLENMMHSAPIVQLVGVRVEIIQEQAEITLPVKRELFHAALEIGFLFATSLIFIFKFYNFVLNYN
jgi:hypothetical protein